jgi:hypothetical protein
MLSSSNRERRTGVAQGSMLALSRALERCKRDAPAQSPRGPAAPPELVISGSTGIRHPLADAAKIASDIAAGRLERLRKALERDAFSLLGLYEYALGFTATCAFEGVSSVSAFLSTSPSPATSSSTPSCKRPRERDGSSRSCSEAPPSGLS